MQKREFLKGSLAALGVFRSEFPEARDIKWDETFDVVVVGSGIAATCAANESIDLGAKRVIMVDKMPVFGGNSAITGFWINVPRTPEQLAHGVKDDSPELFLKDTLKAGEYFNDPKLAHALCFKALESFEYIRKLGCEFAPTPWSLQDPFARPEGFGRHFRDAPAAPSLPQARRHHAQEHDRR